MPLFLIIEEITLVHSTVAIDELALAMHSIILKLALVTATAGPDVYPISFHLVAAELTLVARLVKHAELTMSMPESFLVLAFKEAIVPHLRPLSVLLIIQPAALIFGLISSNKFTQA